VAFENAEKQLAAPGLSIHSDWRQAVAGTDAVAILTAWQEFAAINSGELKKLMRGDLIVDARGILDTALFSQFRIFRIGFTPKRG
jgi:UDP-glucose 6-dehydrogenase